MIEERLFGGTRIPMLVQGLNAFSLRHQAIAGNVVNSETPGYYRRQVSFEDNLQSAISGGKLKRTDHMHLGSGGSRAGSLEPKIELDVAPSDVNDLNNIDIDREMGDMARNHLQFSFASRMTNKNFEMLLLSIRGM